MVQDAVKMPQDVSTHPPSHPKLYAFTFKVADLEELPAVLSLRDSVYSLDLGKNPDDGYDRDACHVVALDPHRVAVAAYRILGPSFRPFDFESLIPPDQSVGTGRLLATMGKLCIHSSYRNAHASSIILPGLLRLAYRVAMDAGITDYLICALPHLTRVYRRASFENIGLPVVHHDWGPVQVMRLKLVP